MTHDEIAAPLAGRSSPAGGAGPGRRGRPAASRSAQVQARARPALAGDPRAARAATTRAAARPARRSAATAGAGPEAGQPWSILVGHDGVFKVVLLTLFDLPLTPLLDVLVGAVRDHGRRVPRRPAGPPRAHNLTEHLAPLLDEEAQAEAEARTAARARSSGDVAAERPGR